MPGFAVAMDQEIAKFLSTSPVFNELPEDQLEQIAGLFRKETYPAGSLVLRQGAPADAVYFIRSGQLAVRIQRGNYRETIAYLQPPDIVGELSFLTGRPCVADVEVLVDAELLMLRRDMVPKLPEHREILLRALSKVIAGRLQETVARGAKVRETPVVLLRDSPGWEAPRCFAWELGRSLARQTGLSTLLVNLGGERDQPPRDCENRFALAELAERPEAESFRSELARALTDWKSRFGNILLHPPAALPAPLMESAAMLANWTGYLLGPGEMPPAEAGVRSFVVQSTDNPRLPLLRGNQQLIREARSSELEHAAGRPAGGGFLRTVDSMARCIAGTQLGLALGGGAAWGWAHVGVLEVLEKAGLPIDVVTGCSMGSVIGAFYCAGYSVEELKAIAEKYRTRTRRFIEWRLWKVCLINETKVRRTFRQYFGDRPVNRTEIPYWANAVDIRTGKEYTIQDGSLVDCVRSSIALPGLLPPATRDGHLLVDAGIMDPVPVLPLRRMGCHFAIGINAMAKLESQQVSNRYPFNAIEVLTRSMFLMGHEIGQARAEQSADIVFTPALGDITMLQFSRCREIIECGRRAAEQHLPAIQAAYDRLKASAAGRLPAFDPFEAPALS
ncbi:MAG TPA: cyclic nucleotide-binding and patatin-like phospholipase domain-containing protein [Terriglobia bacterium]|nr:cyclic nucleotide-binding and patatin-like phospholipase domain-containing protein [Terriglobia bacterium]